MSKTETQSDALQLAALLQCGADDPMWILHCEMLKQTVGDAAATLRRLDAENKALRADAERYRWLREQHNNPMGAFAVAELGQGDWKVIEEVMDTAEHDLDSAVDAGIDAAQATAKTGDAA